MSNNTKIFSEAIAEAKAIRETAMTNAKLALEEAFAPRMQEMMSNKLEALAEEDEEMDEALKQSKANGDSFGDGESVDEISLEELIAELDGLEEQDSYSEDGDSVDPGVNDPYEKSLAEAEDDDTVGEITVDDLKDIIRDVVADLMGGPEEEEGGEGEGEPGHEEGETPEEEAGEGEDELNLDEILAELDSLNENEELEEGTEDLDEEIGAEIKNLASKYGNKFDAWLTKWQQNKPKEDNAFTRGIDAVGNKLHGGNNLGLNKAGRGSMGPNMEEDLNEALKTISILRSDLNEVNLLNAKLLYVNKLFKSKNLTEAQKVKVINAFDRAETVKETKNIFETLKESLNAPVKSAIKESLSFASKAAGVADRKPIVENNDFVARMQKLAGII